MAEDTTETASTEEAQAEGAAAAQQGKPDHAIAADKYKQQRDTARA